MAYGPTSGSSALLITSLADFLPEGRERQEFLSWLADNKEHLINELREDGGSLSENWINTHAKDIENHTFEDVYLPRHFFGVFIKQKLDSLLADYEANNKIKVRYIQDEVLSVDINDNGSYTLRFKGLEEHLRSNKVVVSVGIPPIKDLWSQSEQEAYQSLACLVSNPYQQSLTDNLSKIESFVSKNNIDDANVLIVGANASAMEMIYKLNDVADIKKHLKTML